MQQGLHQGPIKARQLPALLLLAVFTAGLALAAQYITEDSGSAAVVGSDQILADASPARMPRLDAPTVYDHYGNPAAFVKYIIRRPPILA